MNNRLMPPTVNLGKSFSATLGQPLLRYKSKETCDNPANLRTIMGYPVPTWQRPLTWTENQQVRFMESVWKGLPLGTYTFNQTSNESLLDGLLIDGQQRLWSIQNYIEDKFPVFGYRYSEITTIDKRVFGYSIVFACYITDSEDEQYLKDYYNLMNFGGTTHSEDQRA